MYVLVWVPEVQVVQAPYVNDTQGVVQLLAKLSAGGVPLQPSGLEEYDLLWLPFMQVVHAL